MSPLDTIADRQVQWSMTADHLKGAIDGARWIVFLLSIAGALLAALASQMGMAGPGSAPALASEPRAWVAIAAAVCLGFATFFAQRLLGTDHVTGWLRARAISEALKRVAYSFAAGAAPYDHADASKNAILVEAERRKIEEDGDDLLENLVPAAGAGSAPRKLIPPADYVTQRVEGQIVWYKKRASEYTALARKLRVIEFTLAAFATAITAVAGVMGKPPPLFGITFDVAALTAVLTTVAGTVLAHVEASRYDFLVITYLATARRLEDRCNGARDLWTDFVNDCEGIIAAQNVSWIAKWTK